MAIQNNYYLNGPSLASATAVFTNIELTTKASDGWYSFEGIVRQQLDGILLPQQECPSCGVICNNDISLTGSQGFYLVDIELGSDVGATIIRFNPDLVPDGIRVLYNGETYNKLSSPVDGVHESTNPTSMTYVGLSTFDCGISGQTYSNIDEYLYNGTEFVPTGEVRNITVSSGDVSLSSFTAPGDLIMVVPKVSTTPTVLNLQLFGPCSGTAWNLSIDCPVLLNGFSSSVSANSFQNACALPKTTTYYNASVINTPEVISLYDLVFVDPYGSVALSDGYYSAEGISGGNDWFRVQNGAVTEVGTCGPNECNTYWVRNYTENPIYFSSVRCDGLVLQDTLVPASNGINPGTVFTGCLSSIIDASGLLDIQIYTPNCGT